MIRIQRTFYRHFKKCIGFIFIFAFTGLFTVPAAAQTPSIELKLVAEGMTAPIQLTAPEDGTGRRFIVDQIGLIYILTESGQLLDEPFLDITEKVVNLNAGYDERGLLGLAFHPNYQENGRFFIYYSAPPTPSTPDSWDHVNRLVEYRVSSMNPNRADPVPVRTLLEMPWPYPNHNGGTLAFGPEGYLFISLGDGGNRDDQGRGHVEDWYKANAGGNGQDIKQNLKGSILRIDVNNIPEGKPYGIPASNPFVGRPGLDEIWAYGFRNPFRIAFDPKTGKLFAGDAGQEQWEEIDIVVKGGNYGWNVREGTHCFDAEAAEHFPFNCPDTGAFGEPLLDPIIEYDHYNGIVVVGGAVYRGSLAPALVGKYIFADWSSSFGKPRGTLFLATPPPKPTAMWDRQILHVELQSGDSFHEYVRSFGVDADGEMYVLTSENTGPYGNTGKVFKIVGGKIGEGGHEHEH